MLASDTPTRAIRLRTIGIHDSSTRRMSRQSRAASGRLAAASTSPAVMQTTTATRKATAQSSYPGVALRFPDTDPVMAPGRGFGAGVRGAAVGKLRAGSGSSAGVDADSPGAETRLKVISDSSASR